MVDTIHRSGKIASSVFNQLIYPKLGAARTAVVAGPASGMDCGIVDVGLGQVMAITTDPFFVERGLGWERAAWFGINIVASDAATSGLVPSYLALDLNLPLDMSDRDLESLWTAVDRACREIELAIVTGHTGRYEGCDFPMLGGATVIAIGAKEHYRTPAMARAGEVVIVTKGAAIETAGMIGTSFPGWLAARIGGDMAARAEALFDSLSVVPDAGIARTMGGAVSAMHDATERGVSGALVELAEASGNGLVVDQQAIIVRPEVRAVCDALSIDPYSSSSEGALVLSCLPRHAEELMSRLDDAGIAASVVGELLPAEAGIKIQRHGREEDLVPPETDPFWPAYKRVQESL
ncbi:MAG: AIR synthase family protein [Chloroflexota bacterium]